MIGTTFLAGEALRIGALWALNVVVIGAADRVARKAPLGPEGARKLVHITAGLLAIPLPWVLRSDVSMAVLAAGGLAGLVGCRRLGLLRSVETVERSSAGDLFFPIGIALLFMVGRDDPTLYLIGLSYLVASDAAAALVGRRYGRSPYAVEREQKSVEGSVTFFVVSFLAAHLILLLGTGTPRVTSVLVATQLALLATCFEAISLRGNDNVLVPLVTCLIAQRLLRLPSAVLARDLLVQVGLGALVAVATLRWRFAGVSGAITLALFLYGAYALGGLLWVAAPLMVTAAYVGLRALRWHGHAPSDAHHQVAAVFYVTVVGAGLYLWAATASALGVAGPGVGLREVLLGPYLGTSAAQLALLLYTLWRPWDAPLEALDPGVLPALVATAIVAPLALFAPDRTLAALLWTAVTPAVALQVYRSVRGSAAWPRAVPWNSRLQALAVAVALVGLAPLHLVLFTP